MQVSSNCPLYGNQVPRRTIFFLFAAYRFKSGHGQSTWEHAMVDTSQTVEQLAGFRGPQEQVSVLLSRNRSPTAWSRNSIRWRKYPRTSSRPQGLACRPRKHNLLDPFYAAKLPPPQRFRPRPAASKFPARESSTAPAGDAVNVRPFVMDAPPAVGSKINAPIGADGQSRPVGHGVGSVTYSVPACTASRRYTCRSR